MCVRCLDFNLKKVYEIVEVPLLKRLCSQVDGIYADGTQGSRMERGPPCTYPPLPFCQSPPLPLLLSACWINPPNLFLPPSCLYLLHFVLKCHCGDALLFCIILCELSPSWFIHSDSFIYSLPHFLFICLLSFIQHMFIVHCVQALVRLGICPFGEIETDDS